MMEFNETAIAALKKRYLRKDTKPDHTVETPEDLMERVSTAVAKVEGMYGANKKRIKEVHSEFKELLEELVFLPNSPTLMNAGVAGGQLSACFVLPIGDSMDEIFETLKTTAKIHQSGGGTGFSFSRLRPKGDLVKSTDGTASGPVSFAKIYNAATEEIKQGGKRRGANLGTLRIDHPDIEEFITCKDTGGFENFNFSVSVTRNFMERLGEEESNPDSVVVKVDGSKEFAYFRANDPKAAQGTIIREAGDFELINPKDGSIVKVVKASYLMNLIAEHAWMTGDPGILFIDTINDSNTVPAQGPIESTNPCGETPLHPYDSCNLGSINLSKMVSSAGEIKWAKLKDTVFKSVRFLDNVIDANTFPLPIIDETVKSARRIGLGVMGYADMLMQMKIPYGSQEAIALADEVMSFIHENAVEASQNLAKEKGPFPLFRDSIWVDKGPDLRNATLTCIAPTGSLSILANCSSGIEPVFAFVYNREILGGERFLEIQPLFASILANAGVQLTEERIKELSKLPSVQNVQWIPKEMKRYLVTAFDVPSERHLQTQAAFQKWTDLAVSKTVNMLNNATVDDVKEVYRGAYASNCKGVTVFRYGCKKGVLSLRDDESKATSAEKNVAGRKPTKKPRPETLSGDTPRIKTGCGHLYVVVNRDPVTSELFEVIALAGKAGGCTSCLMEGMTRVMTTALRFGTPVEEISKQILGLRCPTPAPNWGANNGDSVLSCPDGIGKVLLKYAEDATTIAQAAASQALTFACPDCGLILDPDGGCFVCRSCGFSKCS
jgi:ribonucleoside-diphosphate reductase alpha chain